MDSHSYVFYLVPDPPHALACFCIVVHALVGPVCEDGAESFLEKVSAVERLVELRNPSEAFPLRRCQVLWVLPKNPTKAFETMSKFRKGSAAQFVPEVATNLVEGFCRPLNDVKGIEAWGCPDLCVTGFEAMGPAVGSRKAPAVVFSEIGPICR